MAANKRQLWAKSKVTFHGADGDREAWITRFNGMGQAGLIFEKDGEEMIPVSEGSAVGQWTAIPPRRGTV